MSRKKQRIKAITASVLICSMLFTGETAALAETIADTLGIGGIFRALRTIPVMLDFAKDMEKVCPDALFINYTNPMSMLCLAMFRASSVNTVGLCHSHQACVPELLAELGMPWDGVS